MTGPPAGWHQESGWNSIGDLRAFDDNWSVGEINRRVGDLAGQGMPTVDFAHVIWPEASNAQNSMAAVSADGRTVWVSMRRLSSSWRRSIALVVLALFHWLVGKRAKVKR
jgi:hypothetical protein